MSDEIGLETRLIALRELFNRDNHEVRRQDGVLGDYELEIRDGCLSQHRRNAVRSLGFDLKATHAHIRDDRDSEETIAVLSIYIEDTR